MSPQAAAGLYAKIDSSGIQAWSGKKPRLGSIPATKAGPKLDLERPTFDYNRWSRAPWSESLILLSETDSNITSRRLC
jgi:hypothetical protein